VLVESRQAVGFGIRPRHLAPSVSGPGDLRPCHPTIAGGHGPVAHSDATLDPLDGRYLGPYRCRLDGSGFISNGSSSDTATTTSSWSGDPASPSFNPIDRAGASGSPGRTSQTVARHADGDAFPRLRATGSASWSRFVPYPASRTGIMQLKFLLIFNILGICQGPYIDGPTPHPGDTT
jgi:hypothetical protein